MSESDREEINTQIAKQNWMQMIGTYGLPAVLLTAWYLQIYKPDQDQRRELERANSATMQQVGKTMEMLVDQDRRREQQTQEMLRILQEQSTTLKQIMVDQKRGAWNDQSNIKPSSSFVVKPGEATGQN